MELAFASTTQLKSSAFLSVLFLENISTMQQVAVSSGNKTMPELKGYFYKCRETKELVFAQNTSTVSTDETLSLDNFRIHMGLQENLSLSTVSIACKEKLLVELSNQVFKQLYLFSKDADFQTFIEINAGEQVELDAMLVNMRDSVLANSPTLH